VENKFKSTEELERELKKQQNYSKAQEEIEEEGRKRRKLMKEIKLQRSRNKNPGLYKFSKGAVRVGRMIRRGTMKVSKNLSEYEKKQTKKNKKKSSMKDIANLIP